MESRSGYVSIGEASLYYETASEGQPLVMIHAGVADSRQWNNEFVSFARDYRVLRYDLRGYGKSLPVDGEYSHLSDLIALLDQLQLHKPLILMGCSTGGSLALDFALEKPARVKAVIMVGSGPSGLSLEAPDHPKAAEAEKVYIAGDLDSVAELETQIWYDGMGRAPQQVNREMRTLALEMNRLGLAHDAKKLGKRLPDTRVKAVERLSGLKVPILAIVGEHDLPYLHAASDYLVERAPSARKVVLADAAHLANMDHPDHFQRTVRSFLAEI